MVRKIIDFVSLCYLRTWYGVAALILFVFILLSMGYIWLDYASYEYEFIRDGKLACQQNTHSFLLPLGKCLDELGQLQETFWAVVIGNLLIQPVLFIAFWIADRLYGRFKKT